MKKGLALFLMFVVLCGCAAFARGEMTVVTSFYPMYVFAKNITDGVDGVQVVNMVQESVGCLHDYQLQTRDMAVLEKADVLIVNGGGMEQFMDKVAAQQPNLPVINAGEGIDMICEEEEHHDHDGHDDHDHDHDHGELNAHVWLDPALAVKQAENIAAGLERIDPAHAEAYRQNAQAYKARLTTLGEELALQLAPIAGSEIITFHEAFTYFAEAYGLHVAGLIATESGEEPSTRDIAKVCDRVKELGIRALFTEPQYPVKAAQTIARETGASVYALDPVVSGDGSLTSYEDLMRHNAAVLLEALTK